MKKYSDKTNNELLLEMKNLQLTHDALKLKMLKDYDKLIETEKLYKDYNLEISNRLNK